MAVAELVDAGRCLDAMIETGERLRDEDGADSLIMGCAGMASYRGAIEAAIEACDGNINQAAGLLEVAPSTIYRKLQNWKNAPA